MSKERYRSFCAIGYPESMVDDWFEKLSDSHIPVLISPLHEGELNTDGSEKKPHFHIMLDYSGPHPPEDAVEVFASIGAVIERDNHGKIAHVNDKRAMCRYFCHLDEKEKKHYDIADVTCLNGFDYMTIINLPSDKYSSISEMIDFVLEYNVFSFSQLLIYSKKNNESWYRSLCDNSAYIMKEFIKSYFWEQKQMTKEN